MESVINSVKDVTSSQFTSGLQETKLSWSRSSSVSRTTSLRSLSLDSKKRSFDGVGHQQCQGRHAFAVYFWTPRNEALLESVTGSVKDDASSQFICGHQETEALMESVISSVMDETSSQFISGLQETKL